MSARDHHRPCPCGAELADECPRCNRGNPLGSMTVEPPIGSVTDNDYYCNGICVRGYEVLPGGGNGIAIAHPDCDAHGHLAKSVCDE